MADEHLGWLITVKGADKMATHPPGYYAHTESEKDWYLRNSMNPDNYDVTRVPDPMAPADRAELERQVAADVAKKAAAHREEGKP